jgi:DNA polymerase III epsilon subunit-like protein
MNESIRVVLLDTETNGLPKNKFAPVSTAGAWPAILQISWLVYEIKGRTMTKIGGQDVGIALDPKVPWDAGAAAIHGISEAEARFGTPIREVMSAIQPELAAANVIIAHNLAFDKPVICAAAYGAGIRDFWPSGKQEFCTMVATRDLVRIPSPSHAPGADPKKRATHAFKAPRLNELYTWLYGHVYDISGATLHSAKSDTHCLSQCLAGLLRKGYLVVNSEGFLVLGSTASAPAGNTKV